MSREGTNRRGASRPGATGPRGLVLKPGFLDGTAQQALVAAIADIITKAPFFTPRMPRTGKPFSVVMTNCGPLGWVADRTGYRYQPAHPETGRPWPPIPAMLLELWTEVTGYGAPPEACLVNSYGTAAKMGLHRDEDEAAMEAPILSVSLGDTALFRIGGPNRSDPTRSFRLSSGDVLALTGPARGCYHGIDRIYPGTSRALLPLAGSLREGGRINLTLRRVTLPR